MLGVFLGVFGAGGVTYLTSQLFVAACTLSFRLFTGESHLSADAWELLTSGWFLLVCPPLAALTIAVSQTVALVSVVSGVRWLIPTFLGWWAVWLVGIGLCVLFDFSSDSQEWGGVFWMGCGVLGGGVAGALQARFALKGARAPRVAWFTTSLAAWSICGVIICFAWPHTTEDTLLLVTPALGFLAGVLTSFPLCGILSQQASVNAPAAAAPEP